MTLSQARQYLNSFVNFEFKVKTSFLQSLNLKRVAYLLDLVGSPQKQLKVIHVAGTKGKGSTCAFIAFILQSAGYKVGLYTSPHLHDFKERIRVLGEKFPAHGKYDLFSGKITDDDFCKALQEIKPWIEKAKKKKGLGNLTFFEVYTVLALYYFAKRRVDFVVLETGLGGRLDATNAVDSLICAITPISVEHTRQLGKTLGKIAREKIAIIKDRSQLAIIAPQERTVKQMIQGRCKRLSVKSTFVGKDITCKTKESSPYKQVFDIRSPIGFYSRLQTRLLGPHQAMNAGMAVGIAESLGQKGFPVDPRAIREGIKNTLWPGRFEVISRKPFVVLDGAHNPSSAQALVATTKNIFSNKKITIIFGVSEDKDIRGICKALRCIAHAIIFTKANNPRAFDFKKSKARNPADLFREKEIFYTDHIREALKIAFRETQKSDVILVTGSLFVVAEARNICTNRN